MKTGSLLWRMGQQITSFALVGVYLIAAWVGLYWVFRKVVTLVALR
jgi:hypothetical protein